MKQPNITTVACLLASSILLSGCATNIAKPTASPRPTTERLGSFESVLYEEVTLAPRFASAPPNQRAARKINEELITGLQNVFPGMRIVEGAKSPTADKSLAIRPEIKEIKFIGGAARFWVGPMAGSSAVLMQVKFVDLASGNVLAAPEFYRAASAWGGGMSMGASDNMMLTAIVQDIITYAVSNR